MCARDMVAFQEDRVAEACDVVRKQKGKEKKKEKNKKKKKGTRCVRGTLIN